MKNASLVLFVVLLPLIAASQINSSFDFILGSEKSYRFNPTVEYYSGHDYGARNRAEVKKPGWRIGMNYNRPIAVGTSMKLGFRFAHGGFRSPYLIDDELQLAQNGIGGWFIRPPRTDSYQKSYNFYFLEIPVAVRYDVNWNYITPFIEAGIAPNFILHSDTREVTNVKTTISEMENLNIVQIAAFISVGFSYEMKSGNAIFFQPIFRYHLTKLQRESEHVDHLFNRGFEIGFRKNVI